MYANPQNVKSEVESSTQWHKEQGLDPILGPCNIE